MEEVIKNYSPTVMFRGTPCNLSRKLSPKVVFLFQTFSRQASFICLVLKTITTNFWDLQNGVCLICAVNIYGDIENFVPNPI